MWNCEQYVDNTDVNFMYVHFIYLIVPCLFMLGHLNTYLSSTDFISKSTFSKTLTHVQEHYQTVAKSLYPNQD